MFSMICDCLVLEKDLCKSERRKGPTLGIIQQSGQNGPKPNALSYEQLGSCADSIEATIEGARKKHGTCTSTKTSQKDSSLGM